MKRIQSIAIASFIILAMLSCNDPLQIGTELLEDSDVQFVTTDTVTIKGLTIQLDSSIAYRFDDFILGDQRLGWIQDPVFGDHRSDLFVQLYQESSTTRPVGLLDSVVLAIEYDTKEVYGDPDALFDFEIVSLVERLNPTGTYYLDDVYTPSSNWGNVNGYESIDSDSIEIVEVNSTGGLDTLEVATQLRFRLDNALGRFLMDIDSANYAIADSFINAFNGLLLRPTTPGGAMLPLLTSAPDAQGVNRSIRANKLSVYYRNTEDVPSQYDYFVGGSTFSLHDHDYSTGTIDGAINDEQRSEELLYIQGAGGPTISIQLPHITSFKDILVNEAILEFTTAVLSEDDRDKYPLPAQLFTVFSEDSTIVLTPDVGAALQGFRDVELYGGNPVEVIEGNTTKVVYRFNISNHIQSMMEGTVGNTIFIQSSLNSTGVERAIFEGVNDSENPIKLNITYTEL